LTLNQNFIYIVCSFVPCIYHQIPSAMKQLATIFTIVLLFSSQSALAQINLDIVFGNFSTTLTNTKCINDGDGTFTCSTGPGAGDTIDAGAADFDGSNGPDVVFSNRASQKNRVCLNDGTASFTCADVSSDTNVSNGLAVGDMDGATGPDVVFANRGTTNRVCLNSGSGTFTCSDVSTDTRESRGVTVGDFDGVNGLDLVFANLSDTNRVCLNNGSAVFTCGNVSNDDSATVEVAVADFDGINGLDLAFANLFQENQVCLNNGSGVFSCSNVSSDRLRTLSVAAGDVDGTNGPDLVFGNFDDQNRRCLNNGSGSFTCSDATADSRNTERLALADVDGVNGLDIIVANSQQANETCLNDGSGSFASCVAIAAGTERSIGIALGNFDQSSLPVELVSFEAVLTGPDVVLIWRTATETNNAGFEVEFRRMAEESFTSFVFVEGNGTTTEVQEYVYRVRDLEPDTYTFRLKQIDFDGAFEYSTEVEATMTVPDSYYLSDAYPNPFNPSTQFSVAVAADQHVSVNV